METHTHTHTHTHRLSLSLPQESPICSVPQNCLSFIQTHWHSHSLIFSSHAVRFSSTPIYIFHPTPPPSMHTHINTHTVSVQAFKCQHLHSSHCLIPAGGHSNQDLFIPTQELYLSHMLYLYTHTYSMTLTNGRKFLCWVICLNLQRSVCVQTDFSPVWMKCSDCKDSRKQIHTQAAQKLNLTQQNIISAKLCVANLCACKTLSVFALLMPYFYH